LELSLPVPGVAQDEEAEAEGEELAGDDVKCPDDVLVCGLFAVEGA
jgi:hypothetical protein